MSGFLETLSSVGGCAIRVSTVKGCRRNSSVGRSNCPVCIVHRPLRCVGHCIVWWTHCSVWMKTWLCSYWFLFRLCWKSVWVNVWYIGKTNLRDWPPNSVFTMLLFTVLSSWTTSARMMTLFSSHLVEDHWLLGSWIVKQFSLHLFFCPCFTGHNPQPKGCAYVHSHLDHIMVHAACAQCVSATLKTFCCSEPA